MPRRLRTAIRLFTAATFCAAALPSLHASQGTNPAGRSTTEKSSISGRVQTKNGTPLAGAHVELIPLGQLSDPKGARVRAFTAEDGTFHASVPWAGDYVYGVSLGILQCRGSIQPPYGQRGKIISFARGEQKNGVVFEVEGGGVLQGVLRNQSGQGVAKGDVTLTQRVRVGEKSYRWFAVGSIQADEKGQYGFCNVPEGTYFVNMQGTRRTFGEKGNAAIPPAKDYVQTFYSGALEEEKSQALRITAGEVKKLDLRLREAPTHHVRGRVVLPADRKLFEPFVVLNHVNAGNSTYIGYQAGVDDKGNFDLAGVPPGDYRLTAVGDSGERVARKVPAEAEIKKEWSAREEIQVSDQDVVAGDLLLAPMGSVSGQLWDTRGEKFKGDPRLTLATEDGRNLERAVEDGREIPWDAAEIDSDGHFVLHQLAPGNYRIGWLGQLWIKRPPPSEQAIYLAGFTVAGRDALRDGFELKAGEEGKDASIVVARGTGAVKAKVLNRAGKGEEGVVVLLVPAEEMRARWDRYQSGCTYPKGYIYFGGVPPGDYRMFAMEAPPVAHYISPWSCGPLEKPRWEDLKMYEKGSMAVHVEAGDSKEIELQLIPAQ